ncbi:hypothetical protein CL656_06130 [bacterium]|nr:hypothetical protein [bacterium]|tara:strand:+ start:2370 stop:4145 length:1776 start_codon:yes stop_codon:yes gene_type:complete
MLLKVCIDLNSNNYGEFSLFKAEIMENFDLNNDLFLKENFSPEKYKLFNQDIFNYNNQDNSIKIYTSSTRDSELLPGVLKIDKTFGKHNKKLLYKCIPDDKRLPNFLIPYNIPPNFNKLKTPFYILFSFLNWDHQHPYGIVKQNLGSMEELPNFYEYILYCKSLQISNSKFNQITNKILKQQTHQQWINKIVESSSNIIDRTKGYYVFSIDGKTTTDYDDALSFQDNVLSIYISNVAIWLDILQVWDAFSKRVSTIYLPNHKRNMLPNILSDELCSLIKNQNKIALTMDIHLDIDENNNVKSIEKIEFKNCLINLKENFIYDSEKLLKNKHYKNILHIVRDINQNHLFIHNIRNSYDFISYLMIFMNYKTSIILKTNEIGIFRRLEYHYDDNKYKNIEITNEDKQFIFNYGSNCAQYCKYNESNYNSFMYENIKQYTHITSPIRRLVDLLNSIILQKKFNLWDFKMNKGNDFYEKWINELDYINLMMRSIRKVQNNCTILSKIEQYNNNHKDKLVCKGLCFDGMERNNKMKMFNVFIRDLGYVGKYCVSNELIADNNIKDFHYYDFEIYLFLNEENMKKKVKIKLAEKKEC